MEKTRLAVEKKALERKSKLAQKEEALREEESEAVEEVLMKKRWTRIYDQTLGALNPRI